MRRLLPTLLLLSLAGAVAQQPPAPPLELRTKIRGRVTDGANPVRGVTVSFFRSSSEPKTKAVSDADGRFVIEPLAGTVTFVRYEKAGRSGYMKVRVPRGPTDEELLLQLPTLAVVTGRVVDLNRRPVVGARLTLTSITRRHNRRIYGRAKTAIADDRGVYRFWDLRPGRYIVGLAPPQAPAARGAIELTAATAFYPGSPSPSGATAIELDYGEVLEEIDFTADPPPDTLVRGRITIWEDPRPCSNCWIELFAVGPLGDLQLLGGSGARDGGFSFSGLQPGRYRLNIQGADKDSRGGLHGGAEFSAIRHQAVEVRAEVYRARPLRARLLLLDPPAELTAKPWTAYVSLDEVDETAPQYARWAGASANIEGDGLEADFELKAYPGNWLVRASVAAGGYVAGVTFDGLPLTDARLVAPKQETDGELVIRVAFDLGSIDGKIEDFEQPAASALAPLPSATVVLVPVKRFTFLEPRQASVRPDGSFELQAPPGLYDAVPATKQGEQWDRRKRVRVRPNETVSITFDGVSPRPPAR